MPQKQLQILGLAFQGLNILDLTGPCEVFGNSAISKESRRITIASATDTTTSSEGVTIKRDLSFLELLAQKLDGTTEMERFDVVIMPGAPPMNVEKAIEEDHNLLAVLRTFAGLKQADGRERWLLSVCTGSGFLGATGVLAGKTATTHHGFLGRLKEICASVGDGKQETHIVRKRWVDAGKTEAGVRIVTAGGVSCGMDAALWITSELFSMEAAMNVAKGMDYEWKFGGNEVTEGWTV